MFDTIANGPSNIFYINYLSSMFPSIFLKTNSNANNGIGTNFWIDQYSFKRGIIMVDFPEQNLIAHIITQNIDPSKFISVSEGNIGSWKFPIDFEQNYFLCGISLRV
jgi:hypothetical protein